MLLHASKDDSCDGYTSALPSLWSRALFDRVQPIVQLAWWRRERQACLGPARRRNEQILYIRLSSIVSSVLSMYRCCVCARRTRHSARVQRLTRLALAAYCSCASSLQQESFIPLIIGLIGVTALTA